MPKASTANSVQPHTEEKLRFYIYYLARYLQILIRTPYISKINIYDMYCGAGIYKDGKTGSAIRAVDSIWKVQASNTKSIPINLHLNDLNQSKIEGITKQLIHRESKEKHFSISYSSMEAEKLIKKLPDRLITQEKNVRNLIFIDPYGYKTIEKESLQQTISNGRTEIILFLPIEQMYRFKNAASHEEVEPSFRPLKHFIDQFSIDTDKINSESEFIASVETALKFDNSYFTTSYKIKNHKGHLYGMFFITSNIYGLEKIIEVKWELDEQGGEAFTGSPQQDLILELEKQTKLKQLLKGWLSTKTLNNKELYEKVLTHGFLPKHANKFFKEWQQSGKLETWDIQLIQPARKKSFYISYKDYKKDPKITFKLIHGDL